MGGNEGKQVLYIPPFLSEFTRVNLGIALSDFSQDGREGWREKEREIYTASMLQRKDPFGWADSVLARQCLMYPDY